MPIDVLVFPEKTAQKRLICRVQPGQRFSVTDFSSGDQRLISVYCERNDSGGKIYSFRNGFYRAMGEIKGIPIQKFAPQNLLASLDKGESFETELVAKSKARGKLVFTHKLLPKRSFSNKSPKLAPALLTH